MWQRHAHSPNPSHNAIRATCMALLPLVEMYCKWELQEDCDDLYALMLRYDSESELESHELGRTLMCMLRSERVDSECLPRHEAPLTRPSPFDVVRERLQAASVAIQDLRAHEQPVLALSFICGLHALSIMWFKPPYML